MIQLVPQPERNFRKLAEIAEMLHTTETNVQTRMGRIKEKLKGMEL